MTEEQRRITFRRVKNPSSERKTVADPLKPPSTQLGPATGALEISKTRAQITAETQNVLQEALQQAQN